MRRATGWFLSFVALAVALLLRLLLDPVIGDSLPLVTLFGAVAAAVWLSGIAPAIVISAIGYVACDYLFMQPRGALELNRFDQIVGLTAYFFTSAIVIAIGEAARRARNRASEERELLQVTLHSIGDAVITTDTMARITYLNNVAASLTGWTPGEARGQPLDAVFRIVDETTRAPVPSPVARALREGAVVTLETPTMLLSRDGTERPIDDSAAPIRDTSGTTSGCVLIFRDVTLQRTAERDRAGQLLTARMLAAIVESSDDAIISKSLDGIIQSWNEGASRVFGYPAAAAIGKHISLVIPPERLSEEDAISASLRAGKRIDHFETERVRCDQRRITVSLSISPIKDDAGNIVGASKIARDITERKRMEDSLRVLAEDLARADRRKDEFLATLAHELRNPLAPLVNLLEVMKRSQGAVDIDRARETMERQVGQLVRLVDDLLDLNRITHDRLELRQSDVELAPIIRQAVEASEPLIDSGRHQLSLTLPPEPIWLRCDPARMAQVFGNLLANSCKYTPPGGAITLTVAREGQSAAIWVSDNGTGIPPDKLEDIFTMFTQVDRPLERAQGGLGIGLTLVKRLVELHGGTIEAKSDGVGQGSEFVVRLPVLAERPAASTAPSIEPVAQLRRILIVDDNADSAESLAILLQITGHQTWTALDGKRALAAADTHRPDVILLDIGLPDLSGHDVCRDIRAKPWGAGITIIAMTGWGQAEDRRRSTEAGFDGHLVKPVDYDALMALLGRDQRTTE